MIIGRDLALLVTALLHFYFLVLEMFLWTKPRGLKTFHQTAEQAKASAVLAANQGLYNGFLAVGLVWALLHPDPLVSRQLSIFFNGCAIVAALYGGATVGKKILLVQGLPAAVGLVLTLARTLS